MHMERFNLKGPAMVSSEYDEECGDTGGFWLGWQRCALNNWKGDWTMNTRYADGRFILALMVALLMGSAISLLAHPPDAGTVETIALFDAAKLETPREHRHPPGWHDVHQPGTHR